MGRSQSSLLRPGCGTSHEDIHRALGKSIARCADRDRLAVRGERYGLAEVIADEAVGRLEIRLGCPMSVDSIEQVNNAGAAHAIVRILVRGADCKRVSR